jgi:hypothetical protein
MLRAINTKIDLKNFGNSPVRQNEIYIPTIPLASGKYSDGRFRLRRNIFVRRDWYISSFEYIIEEFYDIFVFSFDVFDVDKSYNRGIKGKIATI